MSFIGNYLPLTGGALTGNLTLPAAGALLWSAQSQIQSPSNGILTLLNNAGTGFTRLQLGGTTTAFASLGTSGSALQALAADGSTWAGFQAGNVQIRPDTSLSAGGSSAMVALFGSTSVGIYVGSGAPTVSSAKGSTYLRSDGVPYFNVSGAAAYTPLATTTATAVGAAAYTVVDSDTDLVCSVASTLTLPAPATYANRSLWVLTTGPNAVSSASANVVPITGGAAGTAILAATAGKWAKLVSNGTNWQIMAAN